MRVLLAEDDFRLGEALREALSARGCSVDWRKDGHSAREAALTGHFDVVVLDLNLPGCPGSEVLAAIRGLGGQLTPVLVLTARSEVSERVRMLNEGADDYLTKPFDLDELHARLSALCRRAGGLGGVLKAAGLAMDIDRHAVTYQERTLCLSPKEFSLLRVLMENAGKVCDRNRLEQALYGCGEEVASNAVEVHVHHLRKKMGADLIVTIRGVGYMVERST